jgi:hypothetical protein
MATANHYCATCRTHIRIDPEQHIDVAHDGGMAQIEVDGTYREWNR